MSKAEIIEEFKDAAYILLLEGKIFCSKIKDGIPHYIHAEFASEEDKRFSKEFLKSLNKGQDIL